MTEVLEQSSRITPESFEPAAPYTVNETVGLLINSFRFSQGDAFLQKELLEQVGYLAHGRLNLETIRQAIQPATEAAKKITSNSKLHAGVVQKDVQAEVKEHADYLAESLSERQPPLTPLTRSIIGRDHKFLVSRGGRDRAESDRTTPVNDPYLSHFVYYGLMGQTTGSPEYDRIFSQAVEAYVDSYEQGINHYREMVESLVNVYLSYHPEQVQLLPKKYRPVSQAA